MLLVIYGITALIVLEFAAFSAIATDTSGRVPYAGECRNPVTYRGASVQVRNGEALRRNQLQVNSPFVDLAA